MSQKIKLPSPGDSVCEHISFCSGLYSQFEWGLARFPKCLINSKKGQTDHFASHFPCTKISHYCSTVQGKTGELPRYQVQVGPCKGSAWDTLSPQQHTQQCWGRRDEDSDTSRATQSQAGEGQVEWNLSLFEEKLGTTTAQHMFSGF